MVYYANDKMYYAVLMLSTIRPCLSSKIQPQMAVIRMAVKVLLSSRLGEFSYSDPGILQTSHDFLNVEYHATFCALSLSYT